MLKYFVLILFLLTSKSLLAQNNWQTKGVLYSDKNITVEIEYSLASSACDGIDNVSYYRYKITRIGSLRNYYINWRYDFFNCNNELKTRLNSLYIDKNTKLGTLTPTENSFISKRLSNYFNDVKKSNTLPDIGSYRPASQSSMEPYAIEGNKELNSGDTAILTLKGGYLAPGDVWEWSTERCGGKSIGFGPTIKIAPEYSENIFLRAVGKGSTICISTKIIVNQNSTAATAIQGRTEICEGEGDIVLSVQGGRLFGSAKWIWYANACGGVPVGEGNSIKVSPSNTTTYFVRAENGAEKTNCTMHKLSVLNKSVKPNSIIAPYRIEFGGRVELQVNGGYLPLGAKWVWYKGNPTSRTNVGTGAIIDTGPLYATEIFSVRAEGLCNTTEFMSKTIAVAHQSVPIEQSITSKKKPYLFINGGVTFNDLSNATNTDSYVATLGGGGKFGWFVRAKFNTKPPIAQFETNDVQISDYNVNGYYRYNGNVVSKRTSYSGGIHFGGYIISGYIGAGYGVRELLWGLDQYSYANPSVISNSYTKNMSYSFMGPEIEAGLLIRIGFLNIMGGASSIQFKYTDFNLGVGFNL